MFGKKKQEIIEEPEESQQLAAKKLLILYVLDVLKKYSSKEHKLTQGEIIEHINNDYHMECERKAIARNIRALVSYGYDIETYEENNEGYYLKDKQLTDDDVFVIWEALLSSRYVSEKNTASILQLLNKFCPVNYTISKNITGGKVNKFIPERDAVYNNLRLLSRALAEDKRVMLSYGEKKTDEGDASENEKTIYNIYAITNIENEYYLACCRVGSSRMECLRIGEISGIEQMFDPNTKIKQVSGYEKGFDNDKFAAQFIDGFGGDVTDFLVKIKKNKLGETLELFGENVKVTEENEEELVIDFTSNADKVYNWAFKAAEYAEVLQPAAMRFKLKAYFDKMSWTYR